jgi:hypothetical protein
VCLESKVKRTHEQLEHVQAELKLSEDKLNEKELLLPSVQEKSMQNELVRCVILSALSH